jgi:putative spermidine/putrescine transport system permease protein
MFSNYFEKKMSRKKKLEGIPVVPLLIPATLVTTAIFIIPLIVFLRFSFNTYIPGKFMETAWSLENYIRFFTDPFYLKILGRTLTIALKSTLLTLVLAFPIANFMAHASPRVKSFFVICLTFPLMLGSVIRGMGWIALLSENGFVNNTLLNMGIISTSLKLLYTETAVIFAIASIELPLMTLTIEAVLESINPEIEAAAYNLGASKFQVLKNVILPLAIPGILAGTLLVFVQSMNAYSTPRLVGGPRMLMMSPAIYSEIAELANWPGGSAMAFILLFLTLSITYFYSHVLEEKYMRAMKL